MLQSLLNGPFDVLGRGVRLCVLIRDERNNHLNPLWSHNLLTDNQRSKIFM